MNSLQNSEIKKERTERIEIENIKPVMNLLEAEFIKISLLYIQDLSRIRESSKTAIHLHANAVDYHFNKCSFLIIADGGVASVLCICFS